MQEAFVQSLQVARPRLVNKARLQHDKISGQAVLLYPEGVVLLNSTGEAILRLCDGTRSFSELLTRLAALYQLPEAQLMDDVCEYLLKLHRQCLLELLNESQSTEQREGTNV